MLKGFSSYTTSDTKIFHGNHCGQPLFFENTQCVSCLRRVAYLSDLQVVGSLEPDSADRWRSPLAQAAESGCRLCHNDKIEGICDWAVPADDDNPLCVSCRITRVIPVRPLTRGARQAEVRRGCRRSRESRRDGQDQRQYDRTRDDTTDRVDADIEVRVRTPL
jgi:hypothetical protein